MMRMKYPRTPHLPWSRGATDDDVFQRRLSCFSGKEVVVTEKMDGENTTIYRDYIHARSMDSLFHPSRTWVKALQGRIGWQIPEGWRICGENMYAKHSIAYHDLTSYFLAFSVWDQDNWCLSWSESVAFLERLGLQTPPVLYQGIWCEATIREIQQGLDTRTQEGYVVRLADAFHYDDFSRSVAKWVRRNHVSTGEHWMKAEIVPNGLTGE
ncbi:RNA ligase family protein [Vibrio quintilis]|nr:RNA ligase family protein [Vibrio quintilis]